MIWSCIIFFIIGLMIGYLLTLKLWHTEWYNQGFESGQGEGYLKGYEDYENKNVITLKDSLPEKLTDKNLVMKLQNELKRYVTVTEDSVEIQVIKKESDVSETNENVED